MNQPQTPEQRALLEIDRLLTAAGWAVQDLPSADIHAARGVAIREFPLAPGFGFADYLLHVDAGAAGTDIKPLEIVMFMRAVKSRTFFEEMKGRGVRVINPADLQSVTPDARPKYGVVHDVIPQPTQAAGRSHRANLKLSARYA